MLQTWAHNRAVTVTTSSHVVTPLDYCALYKYSYLLTYSPTRLAAKHYKDSKQHQTYQHKKGSPYLITERRVPELIPVLGSQPAGDVSHKPDGKGSPYSITERRVPELIPVLGSQPEGDVNHKPDGRLPLLSARPAVTPATLKRAATNFAAW